MPSFQFTAIGPAGEVQQGIMDAATSAEVIARLQGRGSMPIRADLAKPGVSLAAKRAPWSFDRDRLRKQEVADLMRDLATMLGAGQDLNNALRDVEATSPSPRIRRLLGTVRGAVRDGCPLSVSLGRHPGSFGRLHIGLVHAGEAGGQLSTALSGLAELLERQRHLASTIRSAMIYPGLLLAASIVSVGLLLTHVLPQFVPMFEQSGVRLPPSTQALIDLGDAVTKYGPFAAPLILIAVLLGRALLRRPGPRRLADLALLRAPLLGGLQREVIAARFTRVFGTLLQNGVPLIAALEVARESVDNTVATSVLIQAEASARRGGGLCDPLAAGGVVPLRTVQLLRLGESNARLGPMALRAADIHEQQVRLTTQRLVGLLVPAITVVMGVVVAGIVAAVMTAMLGLNDLTAG